MAISRRAFIATALAALTAPSMSAARLPRPLVIAPTGRGKGVGGVPLEKIMAVQNRERVRRGLKPYRLITGSSKALPNHGGDA